MYTFEHGEHARSKDDLRSKSSTGIQFGSLTESVSCPECAFTITAIRDVFSRRIARGAPCFLLVTNQERNRTAQKRYESLIEETIAATGHICVVVNFDVGIDDDLALHAYFRALQWLTMNGISMGIDSQKIAIVGIGLGANLAAVLCQMALREGLGTPGIQILINPRFYTSLYLPGREMGCLRRERSKRDIWTTGRDLLDLPFDVKIAQMVGLPLTLIQRSPDCFVTPELDYYYAKLVDAGVDVTWIDYENPIEHSGDLNGSTLPRELTQNSASFLMSVLAFPQTDKVS